MSVGNAVLRHLSRLQVNRLGSEGSAGLWVVSLPLPRGAPTRLSLDGKSGYCKGLGQWPGAVEGSPRRLLIVADGSGRAPERLPVVPAAESPCGAAPTAEMSLIARSPEPLFVWERHALRIAWGGRSIELAMGLRTKGEVHWWEACNLVTLEESGSCRAVEMGGAIPLTEFSLAELRKAPGYVNPFLHNHNWLNGHLYARLHASGVCEIFAHHINSKFFDDGLPLEDAVPVIGIRSDTEDADAAELCGPWDGTRDELQFGSVRFDLSDAAHLATPDQPGSMAEEDGLLVWQPYTGAELYGGLCAKQRTGDDYVLHAEDRVFPRGMARTIRFCLSLSPERPPTVVRYLPPAWWFGLCEEFLPEPLLPVSNEFDEALEHSRRWISTYIVRGGFEDGSVPRHGLEAPYIQHEPGWEGEVPYAQFLSAWRSGDAAEYDDAMRSAYYFTDVCVDHAAKAVRMHGYPPNAFALPMARVLGCVAGYLETGDQYLLNTARAVIETAYWTHKNSWPRMAVGRDACFVRGAVMLYRFLGEDRYRAIARDSLSDLAASQREDGSFGDQGGGAGIHQWSGYVTKPWMGLMAVGGAIDYLELFPDDEEVLAIVKRFADWLMQERFDHDGVMGWAYQHNYNGGKRFASSQTGEEVTLPGTGLWHKDYLARVMMFCTLRFRMPQYFEAWLESYRATVGTMGGDHVCAQSLQFVPWLQAKLWQAAPTDTGLAAQPVWLGENTPRQGTLLAPDGPVELRWDDERQCTAPENGCIDLRVTSLQD